MTRHRNYLQGDLPPTGNPIAFEPDRENLPEFPDYEPRWLESGTASLSLAITLAHQATDRPSNPEVIIPAYGCPDLITAAVYANTKPVLVDIQPDSPGYNLEQLAQAISDQTIAIIAVNFLGIPERLSAIREIIADRSRVSLIEDNAQWFPEFDKKYTLTGDYVCFSFGRGKPVSLMGGGCLLTANHKHQAPKQQPLPANTNSMTTHAKMHLYNLALQPVLYQLINRNPWFPPGQTSYQPLSDIREMDTYRLSLLKSNIDRYIQSRDSARLKIADAIKALHPGTVVDLATTHNSQARLLRYPLLCQNKDQRNRLLENLASAGLGPSIMYKRPLAEIENIPEGLIDQTTYPGASDFADRLLTLPTHSGTKDHHISQMITLIRKS